MTITKKDRQKFIKETKEKIKIFGSKELKKRYWQLKYEKDLTQEEKSLCKTLANEIGSRLRQSPDGKKMAEKKRENPNKKFWTRDES